MTPPPSLIASRAPRRPGGLEARVVTARRGRHWRSPGDRLPIRNHETPIPAFQDSPQATVGIPCPHVHQERADRHSATAPEGSGASDGGLILSPPVSLPRHRLGRGQRLKGSRAFGVVRTEGQRRVCGCLIMNWRCLGGGDRTRLGLVTSRRLGGAVVRSRARRLMREAFRLHQHEIRTPADIVLVARQSLVGRSLTEVVRDLRRCLREARLDVDRGISSSPCESSC